eukprot:c23109_g1_i1 orf=431-1558(-)
MASSQLIPGLPNDLAIQCLLCLPTKELVRLQSVSPLWKIAITSDRFYVERKSRAPFPSIFTIRRTHNSYECLDADLEDLTNPRLLFSCDLHFGQKLFPLGTVFASVGMFALALAPGHQVQKFSLLRRCWMPVSKSLPPFCKLLVTTLGKRVLVVACKHRDADEKLDVYDDGEDNYRQHHHRHDGHDPHRHGHHGGDNDDDGMLQRTVCQIFDLDNNWVSVEGLPDDLYATHCFTSEDAFYVRGMAGSWSSSAYVLDRTKGRWEEDMHMREALKDAPHDSKVITKRDALLMARKSSKGMVCFQHQQTHSSVWLDVIKIPERSPGKYFLLKEDEQIFLVVPEDAHGSWKTQSPFCYHGLTILFIPSYELLMVDSIAR